VPQIGKPARQLAGAQNRLQPERDLAFGVSVGAFYFIFYFYFYLPTFPLGPDERGRRLSALAGVLASFWCHFGAALVPLWRRFGATLVPPTSRGLCFGAELAALAEAIAFWEEDLCGSRWFGAGEKGSSLRGLADESLGLASWLAS